MEEIGDRRQVLYCYSRRPGQGYRRSLNLQQDLHLSLCATGGTGIALPEPSKVTPACHWWEYLGQRSDLVRPLLLDIAPWLLLGIEMKSWCSRTWVPPSVWKCPTLCGWVCWQFLEDEGIDTTDWNPIENLMYYILVHLLPPGWSFTLSRSWVMP